MFLEGWLHGMRRKFSGNSGWRIDGVFFRISCRFIIYNMYPPEIDTKNDGF